jgi:hypothetical protein
LVLLEGVHAVGRDAGNGPADMNDTTTEPPTADLAA